MTQFLKPSLFIKITTFSYRLNSIEDMANLGLYLNDLNKFDGTSEMLVVEEQHSRQLQKAFVAVIFLIKISIHKN